MDNKIKIVEIFQNNLNDFFETLIEQYPTETDLVLVKTFFNHFCSPVEIIEYFCKNLLTTDVKLMLEKEDENFFLQNNSLFSDIQNQQKVFHFKNLWKNSNSQQKVMIWQWIKKFKRIAELYKNN